MDERRFYVYEFYKKETNEVFYVGKGTGSRMYDYKKRNRYFINIVNKYDCASRKVYDNLTNEEAIKLEIALIALRRAEGVKLCNMTNGGDGFASGKQNPTYRISHKGKNNQFYGKKHTEETKAKISANRKGKGGRSGKDNPMYGNHSFSGKNNPMFGKTGFQHPNHKKVLAHYLNGTSEMLTASQAIKKFGIAYTRVQYTGGPLHYKKKTPNSIYENTIIEIISPVTTIEK